MRRRDRISFFGALKGARRGGLVETIEVRLGWRVLGRPRVIGPFLARSDWTGERNAPSS